MHGTRKLFRVLNNALAKINTMKLATKQTEKRELSILNSNNVFAQLERVNQQIENIDISLITPETGKHLLDLRHHLTKAIISADKVEQAML